jgi:hypothetical protein
MKVRTVIFPSDDGLNVVVWGQWISGSMRVRQFGNRTEMIAVLRSIGLISGEDAAELEKFAFVDSCPLFSAEVDGDVLTAHGFAPA